MKKTLKLRVLSIAVVLFMLLAALPIGIFANEETEEEQISPSAEQIVEEVPFEFPYLPGDIPLYELKDAVLDLSEVPAVISRAQIEEYDHVNRLYEQEPDEYTVIFQNRDGGKTVYVFDRPVKTQTAGGTFADMTASAIVSANQNNTSVAMMTVGISNNTATTLKAMQSRLEAYKNALDLQPYNMLEDQMETQTLTTAGLSADLSSPMQITPNNSTAVMSVSNTYSELAGEYAIKSLQNNGYIRQQNNALAMNTSIYSPYSKWVFTYVGSEGYIIESASKVGYVLAYDIYGADTVSLQQYYEGSLMDDYSFYWGIDADPDGDSNTNIATEYCHIVASHVGKLLKGNLSLTYNDGSDPTEVRWQFTNNLDYFPLQSVSFEEGVLYASDGSTIGFPTLKPNPTNASYSSDETNYEWLSTNEELIYYDVLGYSTGSGNGIAQIYCRHKYTGIESVRLTVIVGYTHDIDSGSTYVLREYGATVEELKSKSALTMNVGSNSNTLSMATFQGVDATTVFDYDTTLTWYYRSQAFSFTSNGDGTYKITAIMATSQYNAPFNGSGQLPYKREYKLNLLDKDKVANTISRWSTTDVSLVSAKNSNGEDILTNYAKWCVYKEGGNYYIFNSDGYTLYYLTRNTNGSIGVSTQKTNANWFISFLGVDTPAIKQVRDNWCSVASTLQVLVTLKPNEYPGDALGNIDLVAEMSDLNDEYFNIDPGETGAYTYVEDALNGEFGSGVYVRKTAGQCSATVMRQILTSSLENGYPLIASINDVLDYYPSDYASGQHYICIIGYDSITDKVIISDCMYERSFGLHVVTLGDLIDALHRGVFHYGGT